MLKASFKRVDITPPKGLELAGYPHYPRNNTGVHDPLYATCMYLSDNGCEVAIVTLDLLFFSKKHVAAVREAAEKECGIAKNHIMISCIHTHSGPWASGRLDIESLESGKQQPMDYVDDLKAKIVKIISDAKNEAFPAEFTAGIGLCGAESQIGGNRRIKGGPHDPTVNVMAIRDAEKKIRGIMVNYALHPTFIHEWSTVCTADYPCYVRMELEEREPDAIVGFTQGTSGNQSSRYFRQGESFDEAERVGRTLGRAAYKVLENTKWQSELPIKIKSEEIPVMLREFGSEEELVEKVKMDETIYKDLYEKYGKSENREEYYLWQNANLKLLGSEDQLGYVRMRKKGIVIELLNDETPVEIQIVSLGDTCIVGIQGEVFVEYGLFIKAMAEYKNVIIHELANGVLPGYLYTPESLVTGGYETDTSMLHKDFGYTVVAKTLEIMKLMKEE